MADHVILKIAQYLMTILGIWPVKLTDFKLRLYDVYHWISFGYFLTFIVTLVIKFFQVMGKNFSETAEVLGVVIVLLLTMLKVRICTSPKIRNLLQQIEESERKINENREKDIVAIYQKHVAMSIKESIAQLVIAAVAISLYSMGPILANNSLEKSGRNKMFIFMSWFPFDEQVHYAPAYLIQFVAGLYATAYTNSTGICLFGSMIFSRCEIQILQHVFVNFTYYVDKHAKENGCTNLESQKVVLEYCIVEHRKIINFVSTLERSFKTILLMDFTVTSFQFSMVLIQIFQRSRLDLAVVSMIMYLATLALQLYLIYSNAHEIIVESSKIAQAIFDSKWYELSHDVRKALIIIILRAQKPLYLSIGPLYKVRCELLLKIMQALYSYICIFLK